MSRRGEGLELKKQNVIVNLWMNCSVVLEFVGMFRSTQLNLTLRRSEVSLVIG